MSGPALELINVEFSWSGQLGFSLSVPELSVPSGQSVLLLGESGSGKSTLLSLICGTILPNAGAVRVNGQDVSHMKASARDRFRAENVGIIFQQFNLLPFGTVEDNIRLPLRFAPERRNRTGDVKKEILRLCGGLGLSKNIIPQKANTLSVGQQQRVAVARALIGQPPLIVADEPASALDETSQKAFLDLLFRQLEERDATLLMVSPDPRLADRFDRVINMEDIVLKGRTAA